MNYLSFTDFDTLGVLMAKQLLSLAREAFGQFSYVRMRPLSERTTRLLRDFDVSIVDNTKSFKGVKKFILVGRIPPVFTLTLPNDTPSNLRVFVISEAGRNVDEVDRTGQIKPDSDGYSNWLFGVPGQVLAHHGFDCRPLPMTDSFYDFARRFSSLMGPISPSGFRIASEVSRATRRTPECFTIVFVGGSQLHGDGCGFEKLFTTLLERRLNSVLDLNGKTVKIFNFGMTGFVQQDEIATFLTRARYLSPEIVISHSGWNDLTQGLLCPVSLLTDRHEIPNVTRIYKRVTREWHKCMSYPARSTVHDVAKAYVESWADFSGLAAALGVKHFIKCIQPSPFAGGKFNSSDEEEAISLHIARTPHSEAFYWKVLREYDQFSADIQKLGEKRGLKSQRVEILNHMEKYRDVFFDVIHLTDGGHEWVSEFYFELLAPCIRNLLASRH